MRPYRILRGRRSGVALHCAGVVFLLLSGCGKTDTRRTDVEPAPADPVAPKPVVARDAPSPDVRAKPEPAAPERPRPREREGNVATAPRPQRHALVDDVIMPYVRNGTSGVFRYAVYNNQWLMNTRDDAKLLAITGVTRDATPDLRLPSSLDGFEVHGIDEGAFASANGITSITIPATIRFLRPGTLGRCKGLVNIHIAADHPELSSRDGVMFDKRGTVLLAVGSGRGGHYRVPASTTAIGSGAFSHCAELKRVTIPEGVVDVGGRNGEAFLGCAGLERVDIPATVTNIGQKSFQDCSSLKEIAVPPGVTAIPFGLFWRCGDLTTVTLPDGITSIGNYAFAGCQKMTLAAFPKSLTKVGAYAFKDCRGLKGLAVPASVTDVGRGAFTGCDVVLPDGTNSGVGR